jgi:hypothetical protein
VAGSLRPEAKLYLLNVDPDGCQPSLSTKSARTNPPVPIGGVVTEHPAWGL